MSSLLEVILAGLLIIVLAIGPKVHRFKPGQGQWIFKGDKKIHSMTSFREEVKLSALCRNILRHVKDPRRVHKNNLIRTRDKDDLPYITLCWAGRLLCRGTTEAKLSQLSQDLDCWLLGACTAQRSHLVTPHVLCHTQQCFGSFVALIQALALLAYIYINPMTNHKKLIVTQIYL
jgi:hypothetical protein